MSTLCRTSTIDVWCTGEILAISFTRNFLLITDSSSLCALEPIMKTGSR